MAGGGTAWNFTYNADGLRTKRANGSTTYSYVYNGGSLSQMTVGGNTLYFTYDASGTPMSVTYNGTNYYYATNIQGDVTAILNTSGTAVVQYTYDAWGNILSTTGDLSGTLGYYNPLRYRGYVYDNWYGMYYLQSRYYIPRDCRFLNADAYTSTGQGLLGYNMFAYCNNNPGVLWDPSWYTSSAIPIVQDGLNLPSGGGIPITIDGTTYYYAVKFNAQGEVFEYWFNESGDLVHVRHNSTHRTPGKHSNPHDHTGYRDEDGNNTHTKGPEPVDEKFQAPKQFAQKPLVKTAPAFMPQKSNSQISILGSTAITHGAGLANVIKLSVSS